MKKILVLLFLLASKVVFSQVTSAEELKSAYIYVIAKHISWDSTAYKDGI